MEKKECPLSTMEIILLAMCTAPIGQVETYIKDECIAFKENGGYTPAQLYDFIENISHKPVVKISEKACIGDISSFVQAMCDLGRFYLRPKE